MKRFALVVLGILVLAAAGAGGAFVWAEGQVQQAAAAPGAPTVEFTVQKGATGRSLGPQLASQGLIRDARIWRWMLFRRGQFAPKAGRHAVSPSMTVAELATALESNPIPDDVPLKVVEGW